jgi:hypothetical protein
MASRAIQWLTIFLGVKDEHRRKFPQQSARSLLLGGRQIFADLESRGY